MIGISLSFCIRDLAEGEPVLILTGLRRSPEFDDLLLPVTRVGALNIGEVERIVTSTCARGKEDWDELLDQYQRNYWHRNPEVCTRIFWEFYHNGRIQQPRLKDPDHSHVLWGGAHWVDRESLIRPHFIYPADVKNMWKWVEL